MHPSRFTFLEYLKTLAALCIWNKMCCIACFELEIWRAVEQRYTQPMHSVVGAQFWFVCIAVITTAGFTTGQKDLHVLTSLSHVTHDAPMMFSPYAPSHSCVELVVFVVARPARGQLLMA